MDQQGLQFTTFLDLLTVFARPMQGTTSPDHLAIIKVLTESSLFADLQDDLEVLPDFPFSTWHHASCCSHYPTPHSVF